MDVDLRNQNIAELSFDAQSSTSEEVKVANTVTTLDARHNRIRVLKGLKLVFQNLSELILSHNALGSLESSYRKSPGSANDSGEYQYKYKRHTRGEKKSNEQKEEPQDPCNCSGIAPWILALPSTLRVLDVSHNQLQSFGHCTCSGSNTPTLTSSSACLSLTLDDLLRQLRHVSPNTVSLFFPRASFPQLAVLNVSHNRFASDVASAKDAEDQWYEMISVAAEGKVTFTQPWLECAVEHLDVSGNEHLSCINDFLFATPLSTKLPAPLKWLNMKDCGIGDLFGLSAVSHYAPQLQSLTLYGNPIACSILSAEREIQRELLSTALLPIADAASVSQPKCMATVVHEVLEQHLDSFEHHVDQKSLVIEVPQNTCYTSSSSALALDTHYLGKYTKLSTCLYTVLVHLVVQHLIVVDGVLSVEECTSLLLSALQKTIQSVLNERHQLGSTPLRQKSPLRKVSEGRSRERAPHFILHDDISPNNPPMVPEKLVQKTSTSTPTGHHGETNTGIADLSLFASTWDPEGRARKVKVCSDAEWERRNGHLVSGATSGEYYPVEEELVHSTKSAAHKREIAGKTSKKHTAESNSFTFASTNTTTMGETSSLGGAPELSSHASHRQAAALREKIQLLEESVIHSQQTQRNLQAETAAMEERLVCVRSRIADQTKQIIQAKEKRSELCKSIKVHEERLRKRRLEVAYGMDAIQSKQKKLAEELEKRKKTPATRSTPYGGGGGGEHQANLGTHASAPTPRSAPPQKERDAVRQRPKVRSELLREAAAKKKIQIYQDEHPFSYMPARFRNDDVALEQNGGVLPFGTDKSNLVQEEDRSDTVWTPRQPKDGCPSSPVCQRNSTSPSVDADHTPRAYSNHEPLNDNSRERIKMQRTASYSGQGNDDGEALGQEYTPVVVTAAAPSRVQRREPFYTSSSSSEASVSAATPPPSNGLNKNAMHYSLKEQRIGKGEERPELRHSSTGRESMHEALLTLFGAASAIEERQLALRRVRQQYAEN